MRARCEIQADRHTKRPQDGRSRTGNRLAQRSYGIFLPVRGQKVARAGSGRELDHDYRLERCWHDFAAGKESASDCRDDLDALRRAPLPPILRQHGLHDA